MPTKKQNKTQSKKSLLLGADENKTKIISLDNPKMDVEVRAMPIGELEILRKRAKVDVIDPNKSEIFPFLIWSVIYSCYDPDTGERLFDETDYERFLELPSNTEWFNILANEASYFGSGGSPEERKKRT